IWLAAGIRRGRTVDRPVSKTADQRHARIGFTSAHAHVAVKIAVKGRALFSDAAAWRFWLYQKIIYTFWFNSILRCCPLLPYSLLLSSLARFLSRLNWNTAHPPRITQMTRSNLRQKTNQRLFQSICRSRWQTSARRKSLL